jgi:predicted Zn-dependent peptidase
MKPEFYRKVLKNGMTIILEKRDLPVVSVAFAVRNGGINENLDEKGISHFIEHMLYKGTAKRNVKQIAEEIERNGGELNGFTSELITAYWCRMPSSHLNVALDVLGDMVKNPKLDEKELEKERQVIFEEIKMNHDIPMRYVFDEIQKNLYTGTMGINLAGTFETMNSIDRKKMTEKFKNIYQPNNMILVVVGNTDFETIIQFAEKNFGKEKGNVPVQKFDLKNESKVENRKGIDQANLVFAYHVPFGEDKMKYAADILSVLMAEGMSSRLFSEIREKRNLAYAVKGGSGTTKDFGYNFIYVGTMKENVKKVKELILKEFEKVAEGLDEKELNEVKNQMIGQWEIGMEDSQTQMVNLLCSEVDGNAEEFYEYGKNIKRIRLKDVKELAKKVKDNFSFFALVPE